LDRVRDRRPQIRGGTAGGYLERPRHLSSRYEFGTLSEKSLQDVTRKGTAEAKGVIEKR
jgi:hypothetical protein